MALRPHEILLRVKRVPLAADPSSLLMRDPNTAVIAVGTAGAGTWSLSIDPVSSDDPTPDAVPFVAVAETSAQIATAWAAAINAALSIDGVATSLAKYILRATASTTNVLLTLRRTCPPCVPTISSPASTATMAPDGSGCRWPYARYVPQFWGAENRPTKTVYVRTIPLDSSGNAIPVDAAATLTIRVVDGTEREDGSIVGGYGSTEDVVLGEIRGVAYDGGLFTVETSAVTSPPTGLAAYEIWARPSDT